MVCNYETIDQLTQNHISKQHYKNTEKVINFQQRIWYLAEDITSDSATLILKLGCA